VDDDGSTTTPPAPKPSSKAASGDAPGLRAQLGATFAAGKRLLTAHIDLAKAEIGEIVGEVQRMVALAALAIGAMVMVGLLLFVGTILFLGEWLFGSIGWGVLLGTLLLVDVAVVAALLAVDIPAARLRMSLLLAIVVGVAIGVVMGFDLTHRGWTSLGDSVASAFDPNTRAVLLAAGSSAAVLGLLGFATGVRRGPRNAFLQAGLWAAIGVLVGLLTVVSVSAQVGAALGVAVALITWPLLAARELMAAGVDGEALKKKFTPQETIDMTKETIEWVRARTPLVPKS
jgi:hypothetical protein